MTSEDRTTTNRVHLCGEIVSRPMMTHEICGEGFYEVLVSVPRLSSQRDVIPVTAAERLLSVSVCGSVQDGRKKKAPLFEKSGNLLYAVRMDARSPERYVNLLAGLLPAIYRDIGSGTIASVCRVSESLGDTASSAARRCGDTMRFVPYASAPSRLPENTLILETRLPVSAEPLGYLL